MRLSEIINNAGLVQQYGKLQQALVLAATRSVLGRLAEQGETTPQEDDDFILNSAGPAAAGAAVDYAVAHCVRNNAFKDTHQFNGSFVHNHQLVKNDGAYPTYSNVLRQFLLPRSAHYDFDRLIDPRHRIDDECGYPRWITPAMYRFLYDRDDTASRVVDIYPDESWAADPVVYEDEDEEVTTPFEEDWQELCDRLRLPQFLYRLDKLCGIGHYGILFLGLDDGKDFDQPVDEPGLLAGVPNSVGGKQHKLLYVRPFDEYLSFVSEYETDPNSPRHGRPKYYNLVFLDMVTNAGGTAVGSRLNRRVHWTRVIHAADNLESSLAFGKPRQQPVYNRLLDLRKIKGGSGEMFWKGAFPGISFEVDPQYVADDPEVDEDKIRKEVRDYMDGLKRYFIGVGVSAKSLSVNISDHPDKYAALHTSAIASRLGVPLRVFLGSEEGRLASSQDKQTWNQRLRRRLRLFVEPDILRATADRLIALGVVRPPKKRFTVDWADLNTPSDDDKANLALKWTQALSQYVASGVIHLIPPMDFITTILGLTPAQAKKIVDEAKAAGGWEKLLKVDPSQGAGQNGVRENNLSKGETSGTSGERPPKRDTNTKKIEGSSG